MIKFEHNMLVLNNAFSREDVEQIDAFAEHVRQQERERIIAILESEGFEYRSLADSPHNLIALINGES